ncbi:MAG: phosphopantetheine adenylyltransferase [Rhodomicrobium sp.]|nr:MAG: phosphopantetheine adenylyltransferase [Rhodomicrobium sp.]
MSVTGFYPGSFDPLTNGHVDIIGRALNIVDELIIGVGVHHVKSPYLSGEERVQLLETYADELRQKQAKDVKVIQFSGLAVDAAVAYGAKVLVRGLRDSADFAYEMQMAGMNRAMANGIETLLLPSNGEVRHIAAKLVRQIEQLGGDFHKFVPPHVANYLAEKKS